MPAAFVKGTGVLVLSLFIKPIWPAVRALALLCHKKSPVVHMTPELLKGVLQPISGPVLSLVCIGVACRTFLPDQFRGFRVWGRIVPIFSFYMWTKYACNIGRLFGMSEKAIEARWAARHEWGGKHVYKMIDEINGYYVKTGQVIANEGKLVPEPWRRHLVKLWDATPPRPWKNVSRSIEMDLRSTEVGQLLKGKSRGWVMTSIFESVEVAPLASASIAEVHCASLSQEVLQILGTDWKHGDEVVIKVQHHNVKKMMAADIRNMKNVARFLAPMLPFDPLPIQQELSIIIPKEFNFRREARMMEIIAANLHAAGMDDRVSVPKPVMGLCAPGLITMQKMDGLPFTVALPKAASDPASKAAAIAGVSTLVTAWGCMMLRDGLFHADPHPGNFFLQEDGKIALLDFGQVKVLSAKEQVELCRITLALADGKPFEAAKAIASLGVEFDVPATPTPETLQAVFKMMYVMFDTRYMEELDKYDFSGDAVVSGAPIKKIPGSLFLILRGFLVLRGILNTIRHDLSAVVLWREFAVETLARPLADLEDQAARNLGFDSVGF